MQLRRTAALSIAALGIAALAACSSSSPTGAPSSVATAPSASGSAVQGSAVDIAFAQSMIPHHQQAIEMADLALSPDSGASEQVQKLAEQIKSAQDPEIAQMTEWLQQWGAPTAMPGATDADGMARMDHGGHDMGGMTVSRMMTAEQMQQLQAANGQDFDQMWLAMMIDHHRGAIVMAEQAEVSGDSQVQGLAADIIAAQQQEITAMQEMLNRGGQ